MGGRQALASRLGRQGFGGGGGGCGIDGPNRDLNVHTGDAAAKKGFVFALKQRFKLCCIGRLGQGGIKGYGNFPSLTRIAHIDFVLRVNFGLRVTAAHKGSGFLSQFRQQAGRQA